MHYILVVRYEEPGEDEYLKWRVLCDVFVVSFHFPFTGNEIIKRYSIGCHCLKGHVVG